ncbi:MAG: hypothetical protein ACK5KL_13230 [Dysgonomonas sp.]
MKTLRLNKFCHSFVFLILIFLTNSNLRCQVTIGSLEPPHESAVLELKSENDNMGFKGPDVELKDIYDTTTVKKPATGLLVFNTTDSPEEIIAVSERVSRNKYYFWTGTQWSEAINWINIEDNVEQVFSGIGIPRPAIFSLDGPERIYTNVFTNMRGINNPFATSNPMALPFKEEVNNTDGTVTMRRSGSSTIITLEPGIYDISFSYELIPIEGQMRSCTSLLYYMVFPAHTLLPNGSIQSNPVRIDSSASVYGTGNQSYVNHGNTINYVTVIYETTDWDVKFAVNGTGTCARRDNYSIPNRSTYLYISRIGDPDPDNHQ